MLPTAASGQNNLTQGMPGGTASEAATGPPANIGSVGTVCSGAGDAGPVGARRRDGAGVTRSLRR
jgi:hypothetical protein